jgi:hypothetical protein
MIYQEPKQSISMKNIPTPNCKGRDDLIFSCETKSYCGSKSANPEIFAQEITFLIKTCKISVIIEGHIIFTIASLSGDG